MKTWPADRVERWPLEKLVPYARNARTHSDAQVAQIAASMQEWGWTNPILVDEGGLCVEPFGGSGATLMGAESAGRVCYTMELQPVYVDVILRRWQEHTGEDAILEGDGRTYLDIELERARPEA